MGRSPCCSKEGLNKGAWTALEDKILAEYIENHGEGKWRHLPKRAGLKRCGKSCRLRWLNYLRPGIKRGNITDDEEELIIRLHKLLGNRWSLIAGRLPGRTDNEIKNYWNTNIGRKLQNHGTQNCSISSGAHNSAQHIQTMDPSKGTNSLVVQTKATRLTKVNVTKELIIHPTQQNEGLSNVVVDNNKMKESSSLVSSSPSLDGFMANFEMEGNIFSEILKMDLPELMEDNGNPRKVDNGYSSPLSSNDDTHFFTWGDNSSFYDHSGFDFMESEFNWV